MTQRTALAFKLLPIAAAVLCSPLVLAQASGDTQVIEVTAQKRSEKIKDVPLSITAISGAVLEDRGIEGPSALTGVIPNLNMTQAPVSGLIAAIAIRGIASGQPSIWADPSVGLYVDGVFVGKNMGALFDVVDASVGFSERFAFRQAIELCGNRQVHRSDRCGWRRCAAG